MVEEISVWLEVMTMRQWVGKKKVQKLRRELALPIVGVLVRGGTHHRRDLYLEDGRVLYLFWVGSMEQSPTQYGSVKNPGMTRDAGEGGDRCDHD